MASRLTIGLRFKHQEGWTGGVYYVRNLVCALGLLPEPERPRLVAIGAEAAVVEELRAATGYPALERLSRSRIERIPAPGLFGRGPDREKIALILMGSPPGLEDRGVQWVPDFQEHRFPEFFDAAELASRRRRNTDWFAAHRHVMVSSEDVAADFRRFYPQSRAKAHVVRFASFLPPLPADLGAVRARYGLPQRYFLCANQLWKHKNHAVVLRALAEAREVAAPVAFTGREEDYRDPAYAPGVRALAGDLGLDQRVRFLGFLPRQDQLGLMAGALAVVQPSLCEGWSTVVEDAKALGRPVAASDIAVHREQLGPGADLFDPHDPAALAALLSRFDRASRQTQNFDYEEARRRFSRDLWRMILEVEKDFRRRRVDQLAIRR
jgi:glycosyltransferase involved in cell wall biosynthesis